MGTSILVYVALIDLTIAGFIIWSSRRTARRAESKSTTAVEALGTCVAA